jgi:hypothetical protein
MILADFQEYPKMVFGGFQAISKDDFSRILRNIQTWFLEDFKEYPNMVFGRF